MEYSFLNEWVGHVGSAAVGSYIGNELGYNVGNFIGTKRYAKYLKDDTNVIEQANALLSELNRHLKLWLNTVKDVEEEIRVLTSEGEDPWRQRDARTAYLEIVKDIKDKIKEYKKLISTGQYDVLRSMLMKELSSGWKTKKSSEMVYDFRRKLKNAGVVGGAITGGVGYHYAKRGIQKLLKK